MDLERTIQKDSWLCLLYVVDGMRQRHYEPICTLFRLSDEVRVTRTTVGIAVEGYGIREEWRKLPEEQEEAA